MPVNKWEKIAIAICLMLMIYATISVNWMVITDEWGGPIQSSFYLSVVATFIILTIMYINAVRREERRQKEEGQ